jgi:hypothetical protein
MGQSEFTKEFWRTEAIRMNQQIGLAVTNLEDMRKTLCKGCHGCDVLEVIIADLKGLQHDT